MLLNYSLLDPASFIAEKFRCRYRVPYPFICQGHDVWLQLERVFLLNFALRMLGRYTCSDSISELSSIGVSTCNRVFKVVLKLLSEALYYRYSDREEILSVMEHTAG